MVLKNGRWGANFGDGGTFREIGVINPKENKICPMTILFTPG